MNELSSPDEAACQRLIADGTLAWLGVDGGRRIVFANRAFVALAGRTGTTLIGTAVDTVIVPGGRDPELLRGDGTRLAVEVHAEPIGTDTEAWLILDVSARRQAEGALRDEARRARALFEGIEDAVFLHALDGRILDANPAASRRLGYTRDEFLQLTTGEVDDPSFAAAFQDRLAEQLQRGGLSIEGRHRTKDGKSVEVDINTSVIEYEGRPAVLAVMRDVTERNRMRAMLVQSEKLASIGLLSAGIAHEINNPLAYVANNLAILERDFRGVAGLIAGLGELLDGHVNDAAVDARRDELIEESDWEYVNENLPRILTKTREGVQRVATIVQGLRGMARTSDLKMEPTALGDLLVSPIEMVRGRLRRANAEVDIKTDSELPRVACVPSQISQVVLNLLVNAAQAIEARRPPPAEGGKVTIRIGRLGLEPFLEVADNGCGIAADRITRLFDPFYTTKPIGEGTGLGLFICHEIVTAHGGRIEVVSKLGEGSTFRMIFAAGLGR